MNAKDTRAVTQRTGAVVELEGETGSVVGHYDDDSVFVEFDHGIDRCWTDALTLVRRS